MLEALRDAAATFARGVEGWDARNLGLSFHVYGHASVNSLHMHMIDTRYKGPTYARLKYKDLALDDVLSVLRDERRLYSRDFTEPSNRGIARQPSQRRSSADGSVPALDAARAKTDGAASPRTDGATTPRRSSFWGFGK